MRGQAHAARGDKTAAIADFKKVLELSKDASLIQQAKDELKKLGAG
jgi:hypothetical protein